MFSTDEEKIWALLLDYICDARGANSGSNKSHGKSLIFLCLMTVYPSILADLGHSEP